MTFASTQGIADVVTAHPSSITRQTLNVHDQEFGRWHGVASLAAHKDLLAVECSNRDEALLGGSPRTSHARWHSHRDAIGGDVGGDHGAGSNYRTIPDGHPG